ncbi:hypothetical protein AKJ16_DCAP26853, partial [Drosera capensis]
AGRCGSRNKVSRWCRLFVTYDRRGKPIYLNFAHTITRSGDQQWQSLVMSTSSKKNDVDSSEKKPDGISEQRPDEQKNEKVRNLYKLMETSMGEETDCIHVRTAERNATRKEVLEKFMKLGVLGTRSNSNVMIIARILQYKLKQFDDLGYNFESSGINVDDNL